ncbi:MAG: PAS domain-containing sensor histidine kinase [Ignavibacteriales bacterium]|nr:PAS domain-containing sensor histidine kinase [Ignavibacteriales bacterium]
MASLPTEQTQNSMGIGLQQAILDSLHLGILVNDTDGSILYLNDALINLLNFKHQDIYNNNIAYLTKKIEERCEILKSSVNSLHEIADNNEICAFAFIKYNQQNLIKIYSYTLRNNFKFYRIWVFSDSTKDSLNKTALIEKNKNQNPQIDTDGISINDDLFLTKTLDDVTKKMNDKDKFLSIVAHDLKSPFQALLGTLDFLHQSAEELSAEEIKSYLQIGNSSAKNIYKLLEELLEWSRLLLGHIQFEPVKCNFHNEMLRAQSFCSAQIHKKNINVINNIDPEFQINADEYMINSIFRNLLTNAVKFSNRGGTIKLSSTLEGNYIKISIKDHGIGIANEANEKLFRIDKLYSTPGTENEPGSGLGLILCKEMVRQHGGNIWFESKIDEGTIFYLTFPLS